MLSKKEWVNKYVHKWVGIKNCDTRTVEGGYLFLWNDDRTSATGHSERNIKSRSQAVAYHYDLYVSEQANTACSGLMNEDEELTKLIEEVQELWANA